VAILICGDLEKEVFEGCWMLDCAAATENLLLAACARGLGAVWLALYPFEDRVRGMRNLLGLPEHLVPFNVIPLGRPAEDKGPVDRYDPSRVSHR